MCLISKPNTPWFYPIPGDAKVNTFRLLQLGETPGTDITDMDNIPTWQLRQFLCKQGYFTSHRDDSLDYYFSIIHSKLIAIPAYARYLSREEISEIFKDIPTEKKIFELWITESFQRFSNS